MAKFERLINHAKFKATRMMAMSKAWTVADTNFDSKASLTRLNIFDCCYSAQYDVRLPRPNLRLARLSRQQLTTHL